MKNWSRCFVSLLLGCLLISAAAGPIFSQGFKKERNILNLADLTDREEFLKSFKELPEVKSCATDADFAITLMKERDTGVSIEEHMDKVRDLYERANTSKYSIYVDLQRLVNDVHRINTAHSGGGFRFTDPNEFWRREFGFCFNQRGSYWR